MFSLKKAAMGVGIGLRQETPSYDGAGIWHHCLETGEMHRIEEDTDFRALLEQQCSQISASSQTIYQEIGLAKPNGRWDVVPDQTRFTFTEASGTRRHARYGLVGSYNPTSHSWLWSWAFPDGWMPDAVTAPAAKLRALGEERGWKALTEPNLYLGEQEAWHLTILGAYLMGYPLVYRGSVNDMNAHYFAIDRPVELT